MGVEGGGGNTASTLEGGASASQVTTQGGGNTELWLLSSGTYLNYLVDTQHTPSATKEYLDICPCKEDGRIDVADERFFSFHSLFSRYLATKVVRYMGAAWH